MPARFRTYGCRVMLSLVVSLGVVRTDELWAQAPAPAPGPSRPASGALAFRESCTDRDFEGPFGVFGSGSVLVSPVNGLAGPFSRVGRFTADGAGHLAFSSRAAFNGIHFHQDFFGTYTMRPDCTFTAIIDLPFSHPSITPFTLRATFLGILSDQGHEMFDISLDPPGLVIHGKARKQIITKCTARDLFGSYQIDLTGSTVDLGFPLPFNGGGRIEADGNGRISGWVVFNSGGFAIPGNISGSYTVATDCTFALNYCVRAQDGSCLRNYEHHGVFLDQGASAYVIMTEPTTALIIGNLKAQ